MKSLIFEALIGLTVCVGVCCLAQDGPITPVVAAPDKPVVMVFTAPNCEHCKASVPEWEKHAKDLKIKFETIPYDTPVGVALFETYSVTGTPTAIFGLRQQNGATKLLGRVNGGSGEKFHNEAVATLQKAGALNTGHAMIDAALDLYTPEDRIPEHNSTADLGAKAPHIIIGGFKLDYDPTLRHFVYATTATEGPFAGEKTKAYWMQAGTTYVLGKPDRIDPATGIQYERQDNGTWKETGKIFDKMQDGSWVLGSKQRQAERREELKK